MERYRVLYAWKILECLSTNCDLKESFSVRRGREILVPALKKNGKVQALRESSFQVHGHNLCNYIPNTLRTLSRVGVDEFKFKLDKYLETLPDEPKVVGNVPNQFTMAPSTAIIDQPKRRPR